MQSHQVLWNVSLSNGENFRECSGRFKEVEGCASPWQQLLDYLEETGARITALWLSSPNGNIYNLPSAGTRFNPKLRAFDAAEQPVRLRCFRKQSSKPGSLDEIELYTVAEAEFQDYLLQVFVSEQAPNLSWALVTPNGQS